ncbi:MAG TPA: hypothetical protein VEH81_10975 [Ktedonobacteraceae bacterium]|nr:hypothetical protein [Ktedonobacteraceae bacterium]
MEATEILEKARAGGELPNGWVVLPLLRKKVKLGIFGWIVGTIVGFGFFVWMIPIMIPHNYLYGPFPALISTAILGMMLFVGIGSAWQIIVDTRRLLEADKHIIVITPDEFVMQDGEYIKHVPLMCVRHITARGIVPPDQTAPKEAVVSNIPNARENLSGLIFGRGLIPTVSKWRARRRAKHTPSTLAFIDSRTNSEVIIKDYNLYGDPSKIASLIKDYTSSVQRI